MSNSGGSARTGSRRAIEYRNPIPTILLGLAFVVGIVVVVALNRMHVVDNGPAISLGAAWAAALLCFEALWDAFQRSQNWILHEPRSIQLPAWLDWTKRFWPLAAFIVGVLVGHEWWW